MTSVNGTNPVDPKRTNDVKPKNSPANTKESKGLTAAEQKMLDDLITSKGPIGAQAYKSDVGGTVCIDDLKDKPTQKDLNLQALKRHYDIAVQLLKQEQQEKLAQTKADFEDGLIDEKAYNGRTKWLSNAYYSEKIAVLNEKYQAAKANIGQMSANDISTTFVKQYQFPDKN